MKQVIRRGLKEIIVDEVADPMPSSNHVLVRPFYSLISPGTETADIHTDSIVKEVADNPSHLQTVWNVMMKTDPVSTFNEVRAKFKDYAVLGYSGAGIVIEKDDKVTDLQIGQRVAYGGEGTGHGETINVGRNLIARVPDEVSFQEACFTTLGAIAMNSVRLSEINIGETVAVVGLGLVGQLVAQLVRCQGGVVIAIDLDKRRVEMARETGADYGLIASESVVQEVKALTNGRGADCVIVAAASSSPKPLQQGVTMCADRGRIVMVGACPIDIPRAEMYVKELKFMVSRAYGPGSYDPTYEKKGVDYPISYVRWTENRNMEEFLRLVSIGKVDVKPLISHEFALEEAPKAYETIMNGNGGGSLAVVLKYPVNEKENALESYKPNRKIVVNSAPVNKAEIKFALVGAGNLAKWAHLPALQKIDGASLHAVYSNSGARGKSYAMRFGANYASSDYEEILSDKDIDAILIASRHKDHARQAIDALNAGKHVFIEKPMAITIEECRAIYKAVQTSGKQLMVGFNRRFAPYYVEMKKQLVGRNSPIVVSTRMNSPGIENSWAAESDQGGVVVGEGVHFIDLMYWLTESEPVSVSAYKFGEHNVAASLKFEDGSIGNFIYTVVGSESSGGEMVEVFAPGVSVLSEDFKRLVVKKKKRDGRSKIFAAKGYQEQLEAFVRSLKQGSETPVTAVDGTRATLGCLLILDSARTGEAREFNLNEILR
ncbi:MAG TPA: bi-domain-containing oxidoreductase [Pyrinomonadaceae bacterium]|jgi:predicted dehydrogenase/threonine dehydrogenase-like Zn-dependent dehydrogenase